MYDFVTEERLLSNASTRPLHDLALCTEAVRVGQMLYCIKQCRAVPYELKTDRHEPAEQMRRLDDRAAMTPNPSHEFVFRRGAAEERDRLVSDPGLPERKAETPETAMVWKDLDEIVAEEAVLRGESLLLLGIAGTGKTHRAQGIVERLRCAGKRVDIISKTHTASRRAGGATADHWVRRHILHGSASCDYLWIDEVSQVDLGLLNQIAKLHWAGVKFLLSGDFHQFPPICNNWRGSPVSEDALERSSLLRTLTNGNRCTLTECRRGDRKLFDF
jgi:hypothetical protein